MKNRNTSKMKVHTKTMNAAKGAAVADTGATAEVQNQYEILNLFDDIDNYDNNDDDIYNGSDEENLEPLVIHVNSNFWFEDENNSDDITTTKTPVHNKSNKENVENDFSFIYRNNQQVKSAGRKRLRSFYDDDDMLFKSFLEEEKNNKRQKVMMMMNDDNNSNTTTDSDNTNDDDQENTINTLYELSPKKKLSNNIVAVDDSIFQMKDETDHVDNAMILKSCNNALSLAGSLLQSSSSDNNMNENDDDNTMNENDEEDKLKKEDMACLYKALYLANTLVSETYRERALRRYHMKRKRRKFLRNNGRYKKKTSFAKARPRVNGKFISMYAKCVPNKC